MEANYAGSKRSAHCDSSSLEIDPTEKNVTDAKELIAKSSVKRIRVFEHIEGNWPSHVYFRVAVSQSVKTICEICLDHFLQNVDARLISSESVEILPELHISLSRSFVLEYSQIDSFVERLSTAFLTTTSFYVDLVTKYELLLNETQTRCFVAVLVESSGDSLSNLIHIVDNSLIPYGQPTYYQNPIYHISIASFLPTQQFLQYYKENNLNEKVYVVNSDFKGAGDLFGDFMEGKNVEEDDDDIAIVEKEDIVLKKNHTESSALSLLQSYSDDDNSDNDVANNDGCRMVRSLRIKCADVVAMIGNRMYECKLPSAYALTSSCSSTRNRFNLVAVIEK